jgi:DNA-binding CsgD family transcriptional regulator
MPFIKVSSNEGDILDHNLRQLNGGEKKMPELPDLCRAVVDYRASEFTITSKEATPPEIEGPKLSVRESEVLQYLANGLSPDEIALKMEIKVRTVRKHLCNLEAKFKTGRRDQLMARAGYLRLCNPYQIVSPPSLNAK